VREIRFNFCVKKTSALDNIQRRVRKRQAHEVNAGGKGSLTLEDLLLEGKVTGRGEGGRTQEFGSVTRLKKSSFEDT